MWSLAEIYGTEAIAVHVGQGSFSTASRAMDYQPFTGGAMYRASEGTNNQCTYSFAFDRGLLTAGHCETYLGAPKTMSYDQLGWILGDHDNYQPGKGTISFPNEPNKYRGDIAFITTPTTTQLRPRIYNGFLPQDNLTTNVEYMQYAESNINSQYCVSGAFGGESCGWTVRERNSWVQYGNDIVRNVTLGTRSTQAIGPGDSGGPVYRYNGSSVVAMGVTSGIGVYQDGKPGHVFTDIVWAWEKFGRMKTGSRYARVLATHVGNKCIDVQGGSSADGADAILYTCHGGSNQQWYWESTPSGGVRIVNADGKCLSIDSNLSTNGAWVHQWTCYAGNTGQTWMLNPNGTITNGYGKCLSVANNATANGSKLNQWDCIGAPSQKWVWN